VISPESPGFTSVNWTSVSISSPVTGSVPKSASESGGMVSQSRTGMFAPLLLSSSSSSGKSLYLISPASLSAAIDCSPSPSWSGCALTN